MVSPSLTLRWQLFINPTLFASSAIINTHGLIFNLLKSAGENHLLKLAGKCVYVCVCVCVYVYVVLQELGEVNMLKYMVYLYEIIKE